MEKTIGLFKLVTAEEVIAEYEVNEFFYTLKAPRRIYAGQVGGTNEKPIFGTKMIAWMLGNIDGEFQIAASHVVAATEEIADLLKKGYLKETSPLDLSAVPSSTIVT